MPHRIITTTEALAARCAELAQAEVVALDTEFIREKTYFPQLCLMQIASKDGAHAIDPLAPGIDLAPLFELLVNPRVLKVFHAGRQDIEIFWHLMGKVPAPIFDTQIAAQVLGFGESVSYGAMVRKCLKIDVDKASRFTDWSRRPLSDKQINYALDDVIHLYECYFHIIEQLDKHARREWIAEDMAQMGNSETYTVYPREVYKRLKYGNLKPKQLAVLRELAEWRELEAQRRNIPRPRILRDEALLEIAASMPHTAEELHHIRGFDKSSSRLTDALLEVVGRALALPQSEWPAALPRVVHRVQDTGDAVPLLQLLLSLQSAKHGIVPRLVATREELEALAQGKRDVRALTGFRAEIFGNAAVDLLEGKLCIAWNQQTQAADIVANTLGG